jgi:hypothetical protein
MSYTGPSLVEQCYDEIIDFVTGANLTAKLADYASRSTDGLPLSKPAVVLLGDYDLKDIRPDQFPVVIVKPGTVTVNPEGEIRPLGENLYVFEISFWLGIRGENIQNMQLQLFRYDNAFQDIVDDPRTVPTQKTLTNSIRQVVAFAYHTTLRMETYMAAATFIDIKIKTQFPRGINAPYTGG